MKSQLATPIVFIIYKRPETTRRVFDVIAQARPRKLLVIADGPRNVGETAQCQAARATIESVNWDCEVLTEYADTNLGLKRRVSSGLDWAFSQVEEAIILEDDCLPDVTFFRFCEELLGYYREEPRIMHISGDNFLGGRVSVDASYYFSRYPHIWGWATWKRAWQRYDVDMRLWKDSPNRQEFLSQFRSRNERNFWRYRWARIAAGKGHSWASQWVFACLAHHGLSITPDRNLVSNIGVGADATHTRRRRLTHAMPTRPVNFPLRHPPTIIRHEAADAISVREAILNSPSGNRWLDTARWLAKSVRWQLG